MMEKLEEKKNKNKNTQKRKKRINYLYHSEIQRTAQRARKIGAMKMKKTHG